MSTPHIRAEKGDFAKTVLMPGDPLRAEFIAKTYFENPKLVTDVRGMLGYTGNYKGKPVSVMGSGMGMPSIGIYSHELYSFYDVENIIRIGSAGAYTADLKCLDTVLATGSFSTTSFAKTHSGNTNNIMYPDSHLNELLEQCASAHGTSLTKGIIHSSDVFYVGSNGINYKDFVRDHGCLCVEMESFALFHVAQYLGKRAACILTISDSFVYPEELTAEERQKTMNNMMEIALDAAVSL